MAFSTTNSLTPDWLAHRYDPVHDAVHYVRVDRARRTSVPFLTDENLGELGAPLVVGRQAVSLPMNARAPVNFIFHSAYCCSTLLANAYDRPGTAFVLKEPMILNDLVGWRHRGGPPDAVAEVLKHAVGLLARPFASGETCIIKPSNVVNGLIQAMLAQQPTATALLLYAPLEIYLGSIASKGLFGRRWVRDLLHKQLKEGFVDLGFEVEDYFLQTDLQVAAVGWLAQQALFARVAQTWPDRVRTIDSETLTTQAPSAISALDKFFGVSSDKRERDAIVRTVFVTNAKSGQRFNAEDRRVAQLASMQAHGDEIEKTATWARAVAKHNSFGLDLPNLLLP
jgi:hypothetical protein